MAIKAQNHPPGKLSLPPTLVAEWLPVAAEALATRLRGGSVPKPQRKAVRALLTRAFEAIEAGTADGALFWAVDAAGPPGPRIPAPPRIGQHPRLTVVDSALVGRIFGFEAPHESITTRADRFLAATGRGTLRLVVKPPREGEGADLDMTVTEA